MPRPFNNDPCPYDNEDCVPTSVGRPCDDCVDDYYEAEAEAQAEWMREQQQY